MSSIATNKQQLQQSIHQAYSKLMSDYANIPESKCKVIGVEGNITGTKISVCDTLAYLIGWGRLVLKWYQRDSSGQYVEFPEVGYKWNELGKLAQHFHQKYNHWDYCALVSEFKATTSDVLALIASLDEKTLYGENWYGKYTLGRMIQFNTSSPMKNMRTKVRKFNRMNNLVQQ